jgi:hypothetical protein
MPRIEATTTLGVPVEQAFALSQSQGEVRYAWDPFVRTQRLLDGAERPGRGVRTETRSRHHLTMISEYTSFRPPSQVGMKMVRGPWFFSAFGGGWSFKALDDGRTEATWRYTFTIRPSWLAPIADRIGSAYLRRDIERRLAAFAKGCEDPALLARAVAAFEAPES